MTVPLPAITDGSGVNQSDQPWTLLTWFLAPPGQPNGTPISSLGDRTQDNVQTTLQDNMQNSPGWNSSSSGLCNLLTGAPIIGGLANHGTGTGKTTKIFSGSQGIADLLCGTMTRTPGATGTSPTSILGAFSTFMDFFFNNPFFNGLYDLAGQAQNLVIDLLTGFMTFIQSLCSIATTTGGVGETTPQAVLSGVGSFFTLLLDNPFTQGLMSMVTTTGNIAFDIMGGFVEFINQMCSLVTGTTGPSDGTTPQTMLGGVGSVISLLLNNPFTSTLLDLVNSTENTALDLLNGLLTFMGSFFSIFTGIGSAGGVLNTFQSMVDSVMGILGGSGTGFGVFDIVNILESFLKPILALGSTLLQFIQNGPLSLLNAGGLVTTITNNLWQPLFGGLLGGGSNAVAGAGVWETDTLSFNGSASVTVQANGTLQQLMSNVIPVTAGQIVEAQVNTQWASLVGSGSPIQIILWTDISETVLETIPFSQAGVFSANLMTQEITISGNATQAALKLSVGASAVSGQVWFANAALRMKHSQSQAEGVVGISGIFSTLTNVLTGGSYPNDGIGGVVDSVGRKFYDLISGFTSFATFDDLSAQVSQGIQTLEIIAGQTVTAITPLIQLAIDGVNSVVHVSLQALQAMEVLAGQVVVAVTSLVQNIINWFNAHF